MINPKEDRLIKVGIDEGTELFFKILEDYPELDEDDPRQGAMFFSLFTNCIVRLHHKGWSERELINEIFTWCKFARDIDNDEDEDDEE